MPSSDSERWWSPFRKSGLSDVFHVDLRPNARCEERAFSWLDENERARWQKFAHEGARRRFGLCRAALRAALCERLGCDNRQLAFGTARYDKPFALLNGEPASVSFNVSHSGSHGLIAFASEGRIGVDVEERASRRDFDRLIEAAFGENEQAALTRERKRGGTFLFYKLWTIKEALIKALGTGMSYDPANFEAPAPIRNGAVSGVYRFPEIPAINWRVDDLGNEDFAAALVQEADPAANSITDDDVYRMLSGSKVSIS